MHLGSFKFSLSELSGALGDLGTLVPLTVGLIVINGLNPTTLLLIVGLAYIGSGIYYRIPMPVQPLKALSAIAISLGLAPAVISAAGLIIGGLLLLLSITGLIIPLAKLFPKPIIRGIQLGLALLLLKTALSLISEPKLLLPESAWIIAIVGIGLGLLSFRNGWPASLIIIAFGLGISGYLGWFATLKGANFGPVSLSSYIPARHELWLAFILLVIPQIPLTLGNAVIATADTAKVYFGDKAHRVSLRALSGSMGLTNIAAGFLGGMPVCHGSGGLSAHYRFGARTGGANLMIGIICLILALVFGKSLRLILPLIPLPVLAVLLIFTGVQHGLLIRDLKAKLDYLVAISIGVIAIISGNLTIGFTTGIALCYLLKGLKTLREIKSARPSLPDLLLTTKAKTDHLK